jgi:hypothetical protein
LFLVFLSPILDRYAECSIIAATSAPHETSAKERDHSLSEGLVSVVAELLGQDVADAALLATNVADGRSNVMS